MKVHPVAELFPMMSDSELADLAADIKEHGLRNPVVVKGKTLLDGRNRLRACEMAGVEPRFESWQGVGSESDYIASANIHRRHLSATQRATIASQMTELYADEAKERQRKHGGTAPGKRKTVSANWREVNGKATAHAAKVMNVSPRSVERATAVRKKGRLELVEAMERGDVTVSRAAKIAELPHERQPDALRESVQSRKKPSVDQIGDIAESFAKTARTLARKAQRLLALLRSADAAVGGVSWIQARGDVLAASGLIGEVLELIERNTNAKGKGRNDKRQPCSVQGLAGRS